MGGTLSSETLVVRQAHREGLGPHIASNPFSFFPELDPGIHLLAGIVWPLGSSPREKVGDVGSVRLSCIIACAHFFSLPLVGRDQGWGLARRAKQRLFNLSANIEFVAPPHPTRLRRALPFGHRPHGLLSSRRATGTSGPCGTDRSPHQGEGKKGMPLWIAARLCRSQ